MTRRPTTYGALADLLEVEHCRGMSRSGFYCSEDADHQVGAVSPDGVIHWADRRMHWEGLVRFLKLVAISRDPTLAKEVPWRRVYRINMALKGIAREAHTHIPARYLRVDRLYVRASVASLGNDVPLRREAYNWSRREAGRSARPWA